jgi:excisionase family DNA binding protein
MELELGLLTTKEAAAKLRISPSALHKLRMEGLITFIRIGRKVFYKEESLSEFVNNSQRIVTKA